MSTDEPDGNAGRIPGLDDGTNAAAVSTTQVAQEPLDPTTYAELRGDRRPLPAGALRPAADAAPRAERRGPGHLARHRGVRRDPRHQRRRGQRCRDLLHDVQAPPRRRLPRRRLHQHALRDHGRRPDLRAAQGPPRRRQRRDHRRRQDHPRAHRVQRRLRLRTGDDGQLGVHGQHDPGVGDHAGRRPALRHRGALHPRPAAGDLARGRAGDRRLPRRPRRRRPRCRAGVAGRSPNIARDQGWTAPSVEHAEETAREADAAEGDTTSDKAGGSHEAEQAESDAKVEESPAGTKHEDNPANPGGDEK